MLNILLFIHIVIALLLIVVILLQRTGADGLSGISGGNNTGIITGRAAANFLTKTTVVLATVFMLSSVVLANLSSKKGASHTINKKIENTIKEEADQLPIAK